MYRENSAQTQACSVLRSIFDLIPYLWGSVVRFHICRAIPQRRLPVRKALRAMLPFSGHVSWLRSRNYEVVSCDSTYVVRFHNEGFLLEKHFVQCCFSLVMYDICFERCQHLIIKCPGSLIEIVCCLLYFIKMTWKNSKHRKECCMAVCFRLSYMGNLVHNLEMHFIQSSAQVKRLSRIL